jgi:hypothetical protein
VAQESITIIITRRQLRMALWGAALLVCAWLVFFNWIPRAQYKRREAEAKQNLHSVQLALERFAVDAPDGTYPLRIEQLISSGYMQELPPNPFSGEPMRAIQVDLRAYNGRGLFNVPGARHGDFVYYPRFDETGESAPTGYTLFLY